jgi:hypothetical protein
MLIPPVGGAFQASVAPQPAQQQQQQQGYGFAGFPTQQQQQQQQTFGLGLNPYSLEWVPIGGDVPSCVANPLGEQLGQAVGPWGGVQNLQAGQAPQWSRFPSDTPTPSPDMLTADAPVLPQAVMTAAGPLQAPVGCLKLGEYCGWCNMDCKNKSEQQLYFASLLLQGKIVPEDLPPCINLASLPKVSDPIEAEIHIQWTEELIAAKLFTGLMPPEDLPTWVTAFQLILTLDLTRVDSIISRMYIPA